MEIDRPTGGGGRVWARLRASSSLSAASHHAGNSIWSLSQAARFHSSPPPPGPAPAHGRRLHSAAEYIYYGRPDKMSPATPDTRSGVPPVMSDEKRPRRATPRQCPSKTNPGTRAGYPIISGYARTSIRTETGRQHKPHKRKSNGLRPGRNLPGKSPSKVADITKKRNQRIKVPNSVTTSSLTCNTLENKFQTF